MRNNNRSISGDVNIVKEFAKTVISSNNSQETGVSYALKHFPGYGNNDDTHVFNNNPDTSTMDYLKANNFVPFKVGIDAGAELILVNHLKYTAIDANNPSILSKKVHDILFNDLGFTGLAITDDLNMNTVSGISDRFKRAFAAGNHQLLVSSEYEAAYNQILNAVQNEETIEGVVLNEEYLNKMVFKVLAWKYYKGLLT